MDQKFPNPEDGSKKLEHLLMELNPWNVGYICGKNSDMSEKDCPYPPESTRAKEWLMGFNMSRTYNGLRKK